MTVHKVSSHISSKTASQFSHTLLTPQSSSDNDSYKKSGSNKINVMSSSSQSKKSSHQRFGRSIIRSGRKSRQVPDAAFLVLNDGCRNPAFRNVAEGHPYRDSTNSLVVNFNFKAFMFQDMEDGDSIRIAAKVVACVDQMECQPVFILLFTNFNLTNIH